MTRLFALFLEASFVGAGLVAGALVILHLAGHL